MNEKIKERFQELYDELFQTLDDLRDNKITSEEANARTKAAAQKRAALEAEIDKL